MLGRANTDTGGPLIYTPKKGPNAIRNRRKKKISPFLEFFVILLIAGTTFVVFRITHVKPENTELHNPDVVVTEIEDKISDKDKIEDELSLQSVINSWYSSVSRETDKGVLVYDLDNDKIVGSVDEDKSFETASIYKIFVAYEGYRNLDIGIWNEEDESYGDMRVGECLDKTIRESHSGCAENILAKMGGETQLDAILRSRYDLKNTSVERLETTASDVARFLQIIYRHREISNDSYSKMADSMLNQPPTEMDICDEGRCDWRMGLPAGFSADAKVYNKVGWNWDGSHWESWNDAAIVEFPKYDRHFAIAFLSRGFSSVDEVRELGGLLEKSIIEFLESK